MGRPKAQETSDFEIAEGLANNLINTLSNINSETLPKDIQDDISQCMRYVAIVRNKIPRIEKMISILGRRFAAIDEHGEIHEISFDEMHRKVMGYQHANIMDALEEYYAKLKALLVPAIEEWGTEEDFKTFNISPKERHQYGRHGQRPSQEDSQLPHSV